jgi:hypothetical protein
MTDIIADLERFFDGFAHDEEGRETLEEQLAHRTFVFHLDDAEPFTLRADADGVTCEPDGITDPDLINDVTIVQSDTNCLHDLMAGRQGPIQALNEGDLHMSSMMTARVYNYGLLRAFRRGAELTECATYEWEA